MTIKDNLKRSQSLKAPNKGTSIKKSSTFYEKSRKESISGDEDSEGYRLREFSTNGKKVVNRGDSFRTKRNSLAPQPTRKYSMAQPGKTVKINPTIQVGEAPVVLPSYRVLLVGARGVGKTSLSQQFLTSEFINVYDKKLGGGSSALSVTVMVNKQEAQLDFIDPQGGQDMGVSHVDALMAKHDPHCLLVTFSVTDSLSFHFAGDILGFLRQTGALSMTAVILVANKVDMVRSRIVSAQDGKRMATMYNCKYIETSSGFQHNVDELLVGCLRQIQLKACPNSLDIPMRKTSPKYKRKKSASDKLKGLLNKVLGKSPRSCEDLHAL